MLGTAEDEVMKTTLCDCAWLVMLSSSLVSDLLCVCLICVSAHRHSDIT